MIRDGLALIGKAAALQRDDLLSEGDEWPGQAAETLRLDTRRKSKDWISIGEAWLEKAKDKQCEEALRKSSDSQWKGEATIC